MTEGEALRVLLAARCDDGIELEYELDAFEPADTLSRFFGLRVKWKSLADDLSEHFELDVSDTEWARVLTPVDERTMGDLVAFVASRAQVVDVRPVCVLGHTSHAAGLFLALRAVLTRYGVDARDLTPSTPLSRLAEVPYERLQRVWRQIAPGQPIPIMSDLPGCLGFALIFLTGLALLPVGYALGYSALTRDAVVLVALGFAAMVLMGKLSPPRWRVREGPTFGDLARAMDVTRSLGFPLK
jgi:hypothetical protein